MKKVVLAISGSLRKPSFTEKMLDLCLAGMGPDVEVHKFYPHQMQIAPCNSCWACWGKKHPGECVHRDDFQKILEVYKRADYFLLAAPLYVFDLPATVKNVIDRFFVILEPAQIESARGDTQHPTRFGRHPKAVLISSCGFPEIQHFDLLRQHFRLICEHTAWNWAGELLISAAGAANMPKLFNSKLEWLQRAGAELLAGAIAQETTEAIAAPVIANDTYRQIATLSFEGGLLVKAKMIGLAMQAIRAQQKAAAHSTSQS